MNAKKKPTGNNLTTFLQVNFARNGELYLKLVGILRNGGGMKEVRDALKGEIQGLSETELRKIHTFVSKTAAFDEITAVVGNFFIYCMFKPELDSRRLPPPPDWITWKRPNRSGRPGASRRQR